MNQDGIRFCDVCEEEILKGEKYVYYTIETNDGSMRVDVCLDSRMNMHGKDMNSAVN